MGLSFLSTHTKSLLLLQFLRRKEEEEGKEGERKRRGRRGKDGVKISRSATHRSTPSCTHLQGTVSVSCVNNRDSLGINHPDVRSLGLGVTLWALPCSLALQPLVNTTGEQGEVQSKLVPIK